jgi:hypothetical protein
VKLFFPREKNKKTKSFINSLYYINVAEKTFELFVFTTKSFINLLYFIKVVGKKFETLDPRTREVIMHVSEAHKEDVDLAIKASHAAFYH